MNFRETFSSSKYNPKIKITKVSQKPIRRLQTQANQISYQPKVTEVYRGITKIEPKKQVQRSKFIQVYSKPLQKQKQSNQRKTFKVHTNRPFILNKHIRTQADQPFINNSYLNHQRKASQTNSNTQPINKYQIDGVAGKGTFGTVYVGHVRGTGKKIGIKKVLQDKRYKNRQLQILKTLHHTNLSGMIDSYMTIQGDKEYLNVVMDYYPQNLYQFIKKKPINPALTKIFIYQIFRGLMYMNHHSISHRDMKPHNVLVNSNTNKVVICDFGSAKQLIKGQPNLAYICSRCYRAPELIFGATDYSPQIDMWSTGCILIQMINGSPPFLGDSQIDQLIQIIKIMGTPSKQQVLQMNQSYDLNEYIKFPQVKKNDWKNICKTKDLLLLDLVNKVMQYSPQKRFTAEQALKHQYFDQLRSQDSYKALHLKVKSIPQLFDFTSQQLSFISNPQILLPKWVQTNHSSHLTTSNFKNMNFTQSNLNISSSSKVNVSLDPIKIKYSAMGMVGEHSTQMVQSGVMGYDKGYEKGEKRTFYHKKQ